MNTYKVKINDRKYQSIHLIPIRTKDEILELKLSDFKNRKFFHDDIVTYDKLTRNISIVKTSIKRKWIFGCIEITDRVIQKFNSKKQPYYKFTPFDKEYPQFLVTCNKIKQIGKYYIYIKYNTWTKTLPYGQCKKIVGPQGDENTEYERLLYKYKINQRPKKVDIKQTSDIWSLVNKDEVTHYKDYTNIYTIAIDPVGCQDIDDAISYEYNNTTQQHEVGIHIADVSYWVEKLDLYKYLNDFFTIYCPNKKINLFPDILSDNLMSLKRGKERLAMTLSITLDNNFNILSTDIHNSIVKLNKTMTYEKANNIIKSKQDKRLLTLFEISKTLYDNVTEDFDTHNLIENFMIFANEKVAKWLIDNGSLSYMRTHNDTKQKINVSTLDICDKTKKFLHIFQMECAKYVKYTSGENTSYYHHGLKLETYTHFTSPIRRTIDILIHMDIKKILYKKQYPELTFPEINDFQKSTRRMYRDIEIVKMINNDLTDEPINGYVIDYDKNQLSIYIPRYNHLYTKKLYNDIALQNVSFITDDNKIIIQSNIIDKSITIEKYKCIEFTIFKTINELDIIFTKYNFLSLV